ELDRRLHQRRTRPARFDDAVALDLEPFAQQLDLRAAADAVRAFDGDQLARILVDRQVGNAAAVVPARLNAADDAFRQLRLTAHWEPPCCCWRSRDVWRSARAPRAA